MSHFFSEWRIIIRRSLANWRLLSTVMVGVLIAVSLLSSTPFFSNAINDLGLQRTLNETAIELLDIQINSPYDYVNYQSYLDSTEYINQQVDRTIRSVVRQQERWIKTEEYWVTKYGEPLPDLRPTGYFQVFSNVKDHIKLVEGRYAEPVPADASSEELSDPEFAVEGMIGSDTAFQIKAKAGDKLTFITGFGADERRINIEIVGIIDPIDPDEEFWFGKRDAFTVPVSDENPMSTVPVFVPEETIFDGISRIVPANRVSYIWLYFINTDNINTSNAENIKNAVTRMNRQVTANMPRSGVLTNLDVIISQYQSKLLFTQIPLFLIVSQIVAIILYYLITVSNMLIERQSAEIALFRSRGASTWQIVGIYFMEGLLITAIGAAVGPFLGASIFSLMGTTESFAPLTGGGMLPIRFSSPVFLLAGVAAVLCLLALLVPAVQAARKGVVHQRQASARPADKPVWQRFYLDLVILAFGGALYWELHDRGSLLSISAFSGLNIDPLLLITPMLLIVAVAIVFLRFFPILIGLASRLSGVLKNTPSALGLWYIARNPVHYSRLILLLIMAASVGMFSATFLGTLNRSYHERVMYAAGSDLRLERFTDYRISKDSLAKRFDGLEGIESINFAHRANGRVGTVFTETQLTLLAIDPYDLAEHVWYRDDFSDKPLPELMDILSDDRPAAQGLELPEGTESLGLWVYPDGGNPIVNVYATVRDGAGRYLRQDIGQTEVADWQYLETQLHSTATGGVPEPPMTLMNISVRYNGSTRLFGNPSGIYFDDIQINGPTLSGPVVIEDFEQLGDWSIAIDSSSGTYSDTQSGMDTFEISPDRFQSGSGSAHLNWLGSRGSTEKGLYVNADSRPLSAIVSQSFLDSSNLEIGDDVQVRIPGEFISVVIKDVVDYFPTLDPENKGFVIVNLDRLLSPRKMLSAPQISPNEAWFDLTEDPQLKAETAAKLAGARYGAYTVYDSSNLLDELKADPLAGAGWGGVLMIAFIGVVLVSSLGFIVYNYLSAQSRQLDFAVLRTLGFSLKQIIGLVCFEQLFVIITGLGIGTLIGNLLSYVMLPFLQLTEKGAKVLPPFDLTINWQTIGAAYGVIGLAFLITIALVIVFFSRVAIYRTLRMGDL